MNLLRNLAICLSMLLSGYCLSSDLENSENVDYENIDSKDLTLISEDGEEITFIYSYQIGEIRFDIGSCDLLSNSQKKIVQEMQLEFVKRMYLKEFANPFLVNGLKVIGKVNEPSKSVVDLSKEETEKSPDNSVNVFEVTKKESYDPNVYLRQSINDLMGGAG